MQHKDYARAETYLRKAGNSPEAVYARGIYAAFMKDYDAALNLLEEAQQRGVAEAWHAIDQINEIK
jgi:hypothetical protein